MLNGLIMVNEVPGKQRAVLDHFKQKQKGLDTDTNRAVRIAAQIQKGLWLQTTPLQITQVNPDEKGALNPQEFSLPADVKLMSRSHSSSSVSSSSCTSFLFHRKRTASGFIKIYGPNHHWKYKTVVGAQGEIGEGAGGERGRDGSGLKIWGGKRERRYGVRGKTTAMTKQRQTQIEGFW